MLPRPHAVRWRRLTAAVGCALIASSSTGCYYTGLAQGQWSMLWRRIPLERAATAPEASPELVRRLELVPEVRRFAQELGLDVEDQYTRFVPWDGDRIITSVVATRLGEVEAAGFEFPFLGSLPYKGFFDEELAKREAQTLTDEGLDACLVPVSAYSTLGWLADPVTGPMVRSARSDGEFVETLLHELVHATAFWSDDPAFSESIASFIGEEATIRFAARLERTGPRQTRLPPAQEWERVQEDRAIAATFLRFRRELEALYARPLPEDERSIVRADLEAEARRELAALPLAIRDPEGLSQRARLNDACLALRGTYAADSPRHGAVLDALDGDLPAFVERMRSVVDLESPRDAFFGQP